MNTIWLALVKDPNAVISAHFDEIMTDLLKSLLSGREWRMRQASCAAISDLIHGRQPEVYAKYVDEIFTKAFNLLTTSKRVLESLHSSSARQLPALSFAP
jgi:proteasome component ECM29